MIGGMGSAVTPDLSKGGTIDGDLTIGSNSDLVVTGDFKVEGAGSFAYDEIIEGTIGATRVNIGTRDASGNPPTDNASYMLQLEKYGGTANIKLSRTGNASSEWSNIHNEATIGTITEHPFVLQTHSTDRLTITSAGLVGIGGTPSKNLHIAGSGEQNMFVQSSSGNARVQLEGTTFSDIIMTDTGGGSNAKKIQIRQGDDSFKIRTLTDAGDVGNEMMHFDIPNNRIGIGTASPATQLHLNSTSPDIRVQVSSGNNFGSLQFYNNSGALASAIGNYGHTQSLYFQVQGSNNAIFGTTVNKFYLDVEIENQFPKVIFDDTQGGAMQIASNGGDIRISQGASGDSASTETIRVLNTGFVGIGTSSPTEKLSISSGNLSIDSNYFLKFGTDNSRITGNNDALFFQTAAVTRFKLDDNSRISLSNNDSGANNTVFGKGAGLDLASGGTFNALFGEDAGANITTGDSNTAVGYKSLTAVTIGSDNTALGYNTLYSETVGKRAVGLGAFALYTQNMDSDNEVSANIGIGYASGFYNVTGKNNSYIGYYAGAGASGQSNSNNTGVGYQSLTAITTGSANVALGVGSLLDNTTGSDNVSIGNYSSAENITGGSNIAIGTNALNYNESGANNVAVGRRSMQGASGQSHSNNTAVGHESLYAVTTGSNNTALGISTLQNITTGEDNVAIGEFALQNAGAGELRNIAIGSLAMQNMDEGSGGTINYNIAIGRNALSGSDLGSGTEDISQNIAIGTDSLRLVSGDAQTGTIAIGRQALNALTTGASNTAIGDLAGKSITTASNCLWIGYNAGQEHVTGDYNTAIGTNAMYDSNAVAGYHNTFLGANSGAGGWTTSAPTYNVGIGNFTLDGAMNGASSNTAVGYSSLSAVTTGDNNTAVGAAALRVVTTGLSNVALGAFSCYDLTTGAQNTTIGTSAGENLQGGHNNVLLGYRAGYTGTGFSSAIGIGYRALYNNTADSNIAIGDDAGFALTSGQKNTLVGFRAGENLADNDYNTAVGYQALEDCTSNYNTAIGTEALHQTANAGINTAIGFRAGYTNTTGYYNTFLGVETYGSANNAINQIVIGKSAVGQGNNYAVIGNADITKVYMAQDANDSATSQAEGAEILAKSGYFKSIGLDADSGGSADKALLTLHGAYDADVSGTGAQGHGISWIMQDEGTNNGETARIASASRSGNMNSNLSGFGTALELWSRNGGTMTKFVGLDGNDGRQKTIIYGNNAGSGGGVALEVHNDGNDANRDGIEITAGADDASGTTAYIDAHDGNGDQVGHISNTSGTFALTDVSDKRLKKDIVDTSVKGVETIEKIKVRDFEWIKSGDKMTAGFVAQELAEAFPSAVTGEDGAMEDILDDDGNKTGEKIKPMGVSRDVLVPVLIKAVQELSARIKELESK